MTRVKSNKEVKQQ